MTHLSYSVTETIYRERTSIIKLVYDYEENPDKSDLNIQYRHYRATIKRDEYERLIDSYMSNSNNNNNRLLFDDFVQILRPIMMGSYKEHELDIAFDLLDRNQSNTIDLDELVSFLIIISPDITKDMLLRYINQEEITENQRLNFNQFNDLVLRGLGKDIVCGHI